MPSVEQLLVQLIEEFKQLNTTMTTIAEKLNGVPVPEAETKKAVDVKYMTTDSPLASKAFPRKCVRPVREGEQIDYVFDSVADAVMDVFQHGTAPEDIDVFMPDGTIVTGAKYLS